MFRSATPPRGTLGGEPAAEPGGREAALADRPVEVLHGVEEVAEPPLAAAAGTEPAAQVAVAEDVTEAVDHRREAPIQPLPAVAGADEGVEGDDSCAVLWQDSEGQVMLLVPNRRKSAQVQEVHTSCSSPEVWSAT